jgi:hypothetical protein
MKQITLLKAKSLPELFPRLVFGKVVTDRYNQQWVFLGYVPTDMGFALEFGCEDRTVVDRRVTSIEMALRLYPGLSYFADSYNRTILERHVYELQTNIESQVAPVHQFGSLETVNRNPGSGR